MAHQAVVKVLSGQGNGAISTSNGQIVLNLGPFIAVVKQDLVDHGFSLASNIPPISPTVALFQAKDLGKAQAGYRLIKTLKIVLPILALALLAAGVFVARGRRRALIGAALGLAGSMLVLAIGLLIARSIYLNSVPPSVLPGDAAAAAFDAMVYFIKVGLRVVLAVGLVVAIGAFITGPSRAAIQTRSALKSGLGWIRNFGERRGVSTGPVGEWTYAHRKGLRIGAVALFALIFVFWGRPHRARRHRSRHRPAARPRLDRADRPAARGARDRGDLALTHPPRVTRFPPEQAPLFDSSYGRLPVRVATERIPTMTTPAQVDVDQATQERSEWPSPGRPRPPDHRPGTAGRVAGAERSGPTQLRPGQAGRAHRARCSSRLVRLAGGQRAGRRGHAGGPRRRADRRGPAGRRAQGRRGRARAHGGSRPVPSRRRIDRGMTSREVMMFRRRRPLLRAAAVGGGAYMAGKHVARRQAEQAQRTRTRTSASAIWNSSSLTSRPPPQQAPAPPAAPSQSSAMLDQLNQLAALHQQGVLTDDEFSAAKAKLFGT